MILKFKTAHLPRAARLGIFGVASLCSACASQPNLALSQARAVYSQALADPQVANNAPIALAEAEQSLAQAGRTKNQAEVDHLAYMASRRVDLARAEAQTKLSEYSQKLQYKNREGMRVKNLEDELAALKAKKTERGYVITLGDVLFDFDRANLRAGAQQGLFPLITFLNDFPDHTVAIEGHTDSRGSATYNLELSGFRAQEVEGFLVHNGISANRMTTEGFGLTRPIASNTTEAGRQQNRRVELIISNQEQNPIYKSGM